MTPRPGFCGIGIENTKREINVGTLWRSAHALGASFIFTIGRRYKQQSADTSKAWMSVPHYDYTNTEDFLSHRCRDAPLIGVEITENAVSLETFEHPRSAIYLLGPEDGSLSRRAQEACRFIVKFDSTFCLNVATAGSIVLYDRQQKLYRKGIL